MLRRRMDTSVVVIPLEKVGISCVGLVYSGNRLLKDDLFLLTPIVQYTLSWSGCSLKLPGQLGCHEPLTSQRFQLVNTFFYLSDGLLQIVLPSSLKSRSRLPRVSCEEGVSEHTNTVVQTLPVVFSLIGSSVLFGPTVVS